MFNLRFENGKLVIPTSKGDFFIASDDVIKNGTKVIYGGKVGYVVDSNFEGCKHGLYKSFNYYIKYCSKDESYEELKSRMLTNGERYYDDVALWYHISKFKPMDLSIREELYKDDFIESIITNFIERYSVSDLRKMNNEDLTRDIFKTLCFSYSSIIIEFIGQNKTYFESFLSEDTDITKFADKIVSSGGMRMPFNEGEPKEFFDLLSDYTKSILELENI